MNNDNTHQDVDNEINDLAIDIETKISENEKLLRDLPDFTPRRKSNTVQLRKVINGDVEGLVTDDE